VRRVAAADEVSEVDDALGSGGGHRRHDVIKASDATSQGCHATTEVSERVCARIGIHAGDVVALRGEVPDQPATDESGAADDEDVHGLQARHRLLTTSRQQ